MVELEDINTKNRRVYYTDDIINIANLDLDMILVYKKAISNKLHQNSNIY